MKRTIIPLTLGLPLCLAAQEKDKEHTNILFIIADDLRPALGCYGYPQVLTPNIDAIASKGTVFHNAYCNAPISGASRASLLTGIYPDMPERFSAFDAWASKDAPDAPSLPGWFKSKGYTTLSVGKVFHNLKDHDEDWSEYPWRLNPEGYGKDWAEYNKWELWQNDSSAAFINPKTRRGPFCESADKPDECYDDGQVALKAVSNLHRLAESGEPFMMAVGFWRPHLPFNAPRKYWELYERDKIETASNRYRPENLPKECTGSTEIKGYALTENTKDTEFHKLARHGYYACVSFIDAQIGKITAALEQTGLAENTVIVLIGDHGWHLGEHEFWGKHNLLFNAINVPLIISDPEVKDKYKARHSTATAQFIDLFPTFCDYASIDCPEGLDGKSLRPVVSEGKKSIRKYAFIHWRSGLAICDERYTYAAWYDNSGKKVSEMLFDHKEDPQENINAVAQPSYSKTVDRLSKELEEYRLTLK